MHVIAPAAFGGLEQVVFQLASGRVARGGATEVLSLIGMESATPPLVESLRDAGVPASLARSPGRAYFQAQRAIGAAAAAFGADVLHTHGYLPDVIGIRPARRVRAGLVSTAHGFTGGRTACSSGGGDSILSPWCRGRCSAGWSKAESLPACWSSAQTPGAGRSRWIARPRAPDWTSPLRRGSSDGLVGCPEKKDPT